MSKQSKPGQSKPIEQPQPQPTPEERVAQCEKGLSALCHSLKLTPLVGQFTVDGQFVPIRNLPIKLVFVPNENLIQSEK